MRLKFTIPAPDEHTQFSPGCFDRMMGQVFPMTVDGRERFDAKVIGIEYPNGGREVSMLVRLG